MPSAWIPAVPQARSRSRLRRLASFTGLALVGMLVLGIACWGALALLYFDALPPARRTVLASSFGAAGLLAFAALASGRWRWRATGAFLALFAVVLMAWFTLLEPTNEGDWLPDSARLASASIDGEQVVVHNIRNFDYRTETDATPAWVDRTYDLRRLDAVDLVTVYWMGPAIAHVFLSFGFGEQGRLAISIEARKQAGQGYSSLKGFFRQYELQYVVADERDVVRLRTNYRHDPPEEVYLYPLRGSREDARRLFLAYMDKVNALHDRPEFYNTLTANCTSNIWVHSLVNPDHVPYSWKILVSGYLPEYLYEHGKLDTSLPFEQLRERAHVNERAWLVDQAPDFSARIRDVPPPSPRNARRRQDGAAR
jgi:hypothetical protein